MPYYGPRFVFKGSRCDYQEPLAIRRHSRLDVSLRGKFMVAPEHKGIVRFTATGPGGWLDADIVDLSEGGLAFMSTVFVPRRTILAVRMLGPTEAIQPLVELTLRIQRVQMTDRRPAYLIGGAFENLQPDQRQILQTIVEQFR